jgi:Na+-driven multidrug efflux pump
MGYGATSTYVFQGTGRGITAMFQTILRETVFSLAFAYFFAVFLGYGEYGAWFGIIAGELVVNTITMIWADRYIKSLIENNGEKR